MGQCFLHFRYQNSVALPYCVQIELPIMCKMQRLMNNLTTVFTNFYRIRPLAWLVSSASHYLSKAIVNLLFYALFSQLFSRLLPFSFLLSACLIFFPLPFPFKDSLSEIKTRRLMNFCNNAIISLYHDRFFPRCHSWLRRSVLCFRGWNGIWKTNQVLASQLGQSTSWFFSLG